MDKKDLLNSIKNQLDNVNADVSLLIKCFKTEETLCSFRADVRMVSASIIKIPVMLTALDMVYKGEISLNTVIHIKKSDILEDTEVFENGDGDFTLNELIVWMIINSDNTATNRLIEFMGMDRINNYCNEIKLTDTILERKMLDFDSIKEGRNNYISNMDMLHIFTLLHQKTILNPELCDYSISVLMRQRHKQNAMRYIFDDITVAHKTGGLDFLDHDVGIFYLTDTCYYFGALVDKAPDHEYGKRWIGKIAKMVYEYYK